MSLLMKSWKVRVRVRIVMCQEPPLSIEFALVHVI